MIKNIQKFYHKRFQIFKVPEPDESIKNIISHIYLKKYENVKLFQNHQCSIVKIQKLQRLFSLRLQNFPIQYLVQKWHFRKLIVFVQRPVLIPRFETERLIDISISKITNHVNFLEIGCGSGIISISLIKELPQLMGQTIDIEQKCIDLTNKNIKFCLNENQQRRLQVKKIDFNQIIDQQYDFIISNPPYIKSNDVKTLHKQVRNYEDHKALDGGYDGLMIIKQIIAFSLKNVKKEGFVILECGEDHIYELKDYIKVKFNINAEIMKDQFEIDRFIYYIV